MAVSLSVHPSDLLCIMSYAHFLWHHSPLDSFRTKPSFCCCCLVAKSCLTLCHPTDCSTPGFPVLHYLLEFAQTPHNLLPHVTSVHLSAANSSPWVEIVPQSQHSSSQLLSLLEDLCPCPGCVWLRQGLSDSHSI